MIRVVLTGSESTGKTTLAEELARHYDAELVPEFVRGFAEARGGMIEFGDHGPIARGQMALEDEHIARGGDVLMQDTDLLSTVVYCRHYFGRCPRGSKRPRRRAGRTCISSARPTFRGSPTACATAGRRDEMQELFRDAVRASGALRRARRRQSDAARKGHHCG